MKKKIYIMPTMGISICSTGSICTASAGVSGNEGPDYDGETTGEDESDVKIFKGVWDDICDE